MLRTSRAAAPFAALALAAGLAAAQGGWLTVSGSQDDPNLDTIQVDPVPVDAKGQLRVMRIRVSRALLRANWEGVPYRSYLARVQIDCSAHKARYLSAEFFMQPLWRGDSHRFTDYSKPPYRAMEFREAQPNPTQRIIRAACGG